MKCLEILTEIFEKPSGYQFKKVSDNSQMSWYEFKTNRCIRPDDETEYEHTKWSSWHVEDCKTQNDPFEIKYLVSFEADEEIKSLDGKETWYIWDCVFRVNNTFMLNKIGGSSTGILKTGNEYEVFSTVFEILKTFVKSKANVGAIRFSAHEINRAELYFKMLERFTKIAPEFKDNYETGYDGKAFYIWNSDWASLVESLANNENNPYRLNALYLLKGLKDIAEYKKQQSKSLTEDHIYNYSQWGFVLPDNKILNAPALEKFHTARTHDAVWSQLPLSRKAPDLDKALDVMPLLIRWYIIGDTLAIDARVTKAEPQTATEVIKRINQLVFLYKSDFVKVVWDWHLGGKGPLTKIFKKFLPQEPLSRREFQDHLSTVKQHLEKVGK